MGVVIHLPFVRDKQLEQKRNIIELVFLIDKYIPENKKFVINKIKKEQSVTN